MTCSWSHRSYLNLIVYSFLFGDLGIDSNCGDSCCIVFQDYKICKQKLRGLTISDVTFGQIVSPCDSNYDCCCNIRDVALMKACF